MRSATMTLALAVALAFLSTAATPARAQPQPDETFTSAVFQLRRCMSVSRDGRHNLLLRALRQLGDPQLEPLFSALVQSEHPTLKIHGLLGLAEANPDRKLDLVRIAAVENAAVQAEIISAAMDSEMLTDEQARQLINWPGLDDGVKVIVAAQLIKSKQFNTPDLLRNAAKNSDNIARSALCHLLLLQLGDASAMAELQKLDKSDDPRRDSAREMLLHTALRYEFDRAAPWAAAVSTETGVSAKLGLIALRVAMRFNAPGSVETWHRQYESNPDPAQRTRLALVALQLAPWMAPAIYEPLLTSDDSLVKQIGFAGRAIASKTDIADAVVALVEMGHPIANSWALGYAKKYAQDADAHGILMGLILTGRDGEDRSRAQRTDDAVAAVQALAERSPETATGLLRPILADPKTDPHFAQAVLVGLIRCQTGQPHKTVEGLSFDNTTTNNIAVLLLAKHDVPLTQQQLHDLSLVVRGGGSLLGSLRLQAAWTYLKITSQTRQALAEVLGST